MASFQESMSFFGAFLSSPNQVGAVAPSSRFLAKALTRPLAAKSRAVNILEVGAGTGAVTRHIAPLIGPDDRLDICEANPKLAEHLREHVVDQPPLAEASGSGRVRLFAQMLQDVDDLLGYDFIISGLPLTAFRLADARRVLKKIRETARPGCTFSYFEYVAVRPFLVLVRRGESGRPFRLLSAYLDAQIERYQIERDLVWLNLPPAFARHFRFD